ncbi:MAG: MOSC domain-containing protein, partial [Xanthobacteraceae bacterium]
TVRAIAGTVGAEVDPLRFRGNLYVEGLPAWEEFAWVGNRIAAGGVEFAVVDRIDRCAATNVDPKTGVRDLTIPRSLLEAYGHADCGVYLEVVSTGELSVGDAIEPL